MTFIEVTRSMGLDFVRCQRSDGSFYGTSGKCRKGREVDGFERIRKIVEKSFDKDDTRGGGLAHKEGLKRIGKGIYGHTYDAGNGVIKVGDIAGGEVSIMNELKGVKGIPRVIASTITTQESILAMTKAQGEPLWDKYYSSDPEPFNEALDKIIPILKQIHKKGIAHNDLHQGNMMYDDKTKIAHIIDFGQSLRNDPVKALEDVGDIMGFIEDREGFSDVLSYKNISKFYSANKKAEAKYDDLLDPELDPKKAKTILDEIWKDAS